MHLTKESQFTSFSSAVFCDVPLCCWVELDPGNRRGLEIGLCWFVFRIHVLKVKVHLGEFVHCSVVR
jgi:hypothetical protein